MNLKYLSREKDKWEAKHVCLCTAQIKQTYISLCFYDTVTKIYLQSVLDETSVMGSLVNEVA